MKQEESFDIVNENDEVVGKALRSECHSNPKLIHRGIYVFIVNKKGEILLQKRSMNKDVGAGKWDVSVAGHNDLGEDCHDAARREIKEELGMVLDVRLVGKMLIEFGNETEMDTIFEAVTDGQKMTLQEEEVEEVAFFSLDETRNIPRNKVGDKFHEIVDFYLKNR